MGLKTVDESPYGVYLWQLPDGRFLSDDEQNFLSINSVRGDISRMATIARTAAELGFPEGSPSFQPGVRKISDSEYERQKERLLAGEIPDEYDVAALIDEQRFKNA